MYRGWAFGGPSLLQQLQFAKQQLQSSKQKGLWGSHETVGAVRWSG